MKKKLLSTLAILAFCSTAAHAGLLSSEHMYGQVGAGWAIGASETEEAALFDIGVGTRINQYFKTDLTLEYRPWGKEEFKSSGVKDVKTDMYSLDAMMNVYAEYPVWNKFSIYGTGGVGFAYNKTDSKNGYKGKGKNNFAWNVGAGVQYALTESMAIDLGYRFTDLGKARVKNSEDSISVNSKVRYNDIKLGLQFCF